MNKKDKSTSLAKTEANRQNALQSTGPGTPVGKAVSSMNAVKHGILSKALVIREGEGKESLEELSQIRQAGFDHYLPIGPLEEMLVDRIVTCFWRMRRVIAFETGAIRQQLDSITDRRRFSRENEFDVATQVVVNTGMDNAYRSFMNSTSLGLEAIVKKLKAARDSISKEGEISHESANEIIQTCGYFHGQTPLTAAQLAIILEEGDLERIGKFSNCVRQYLINKKLLDNRAKDPKKILKVLLTDILDQTIRTVKKRLVEVKRQEALEDQAAKLAAHIPKQSDIDKICRYEAHLERQLSRAMDQLEKLQRMRSGEKTPPRMNLDLRVDNVRIFPGSNCETKPIDGEGECTE